MTNDGTKAGRVHKFLIDLPQPVRQALSRAIEKAGFEGQQEPLYDFLGQELKKVAFELNENPRRVPAPSRFFFRPVETYLIDHKTKYKAHGRIHRGALQAIWLWIENTVAQEELQLIRARFDAITRDIDDIDEDALEATEKEMRALLLPKIAHELESACETPDARRKFAVRIGGERNFLEALDICALLTHHDAVEAFRLSLPVSCSLGNQAQVEAIAESLNTLAQINPLLPSFAALQLQKAIGHPDQLPMWAIALSGTDDIKKIMLSPFAALIDISMSDCMLSAELCIADLAKPFTQSRSIPHVRAYALYCRQLRSAVDVDINTPWASRLTDIRQRLSDRLSDEFMQVFQLMRRNVRPLRAFGDQSPYPPDGFDIGRLCFIIDLMEAVHASAQEFALNEMMTRTRTECEAYLEHAVISLQDELRTQHGDRRLIVLAYAEAAIEVSRAWFGDEHAAALRRSFEAIPAPALAPPSTQKATA